MKDNFDDNIVGITGLNGAPTPSGGHVYYRVVKQNDDCQITPMTCFYGLQTAMQMTETDIEPVLVDCMEKELLWLNESERLRVAGESITGRLSSFVAMAKGKGYRGIKFMDDYKNAGIMVFDPTDVKSPHNGLPWNDQVDPSYKGGPHLVPVR